MFGSPASNAVPYSSLPWEKGKDGEKIGERAIKLPLHISNSMSTGKEKGHFFSFLFLTLYLKKQDSMSCYDWASKVIHQVATTCKIHSFLILNLYLFSCIICTKQFQDRSFFQRIAIKQPKLELSSVLSNIYLCAKGRQQWSDKEYHERVQYCCLECTGSLITSPLSWSSPPESIVLFISRCKAKINPS